MRCEQREHSFLLGEELEQRPPKRERAFNRSAFEPPAARLPFPELVQEQQTPVLERVQHSPHCLDLHCEAREPSLRLVFGCHTHRDRIQQRELRVLYSRRLPLPTAAGTKLPHCARIHSTPICRRNVLLPAQFAPRTSCAGASGVKSRSFGTNAAFCRRISSAASGSESQAAARRYATPASPPASTAQAAPLLRSPR